MSKNLASFDANQKVPTLMQKVQIFIHFHVFMLCNVATYSYFSFLK